MNDSRRTPRKWTNPEAIRSSERIKKGSKAGRTKRHHKVNPPLAELSTSCGYINMPRARRLKAKTRATLDIRLSPSFSFLHNLYGSMPGRRSPGKEEMLHSFRINNFEWKEMALIKKREINFSGKTIE
jgi:hypothetical protein